MTTSHRTTTTTPEQYVAGLTDFGPGRSYTFTRRPDGLTDIDVVVVREGKKVKGRLLGFVLGTIGTGVLKKAFENSSGPSKPGTAAQRLHASVKDRPPPDVWDFPTP